MKFSLVRTQQLCKPAWSCESWGDRTTDKANQCLKFAGTLFSSRVYGWRNLLHRLWCRTRRDGVTRLAEKTTHGAPRREHAKGSPLSCAASPLQATPYVKLQNLQPVKFDCPATKGVKNTFLYRKDFTEIYWKTIKS